MEKQFEFKYGGDNEIDINVLITSQLHFLSIINELQKEIAPNVKLQIKVRGFRQGSFVVLLTLESSFLKDLFNKENISVLSGILTSFGLIIKLYKYLQGNKPESTKEINGDNVEVKNNDNSTIIINKNIFNIYKNNVTIANAVQKNFEYLNQTENIDFIEITETDKQHNTILKVEKEEFESLTKGNAYFDTDKDEQLHREETIFIKKANLFPEKGKIFIWEFMHKGRDIKAKIIDTNFIQSINDGQRIGQGDRLIVDLLIYYKWIEKYNTFAETGKFDVIKVYKLQGRQEQTKFNFT